MIGFQQANSQTYVSENINPKAIKTYEQAVEYLKDGDLIEAIPLIQKSIIQDTNYVDAILSLAGVYGQLKKHDLSVQFYEIAKRKDTTYFRQYHLPYSINLAGQGKFEEALAAVNYFLSVPKISDRSIKSGNYRKRCYEFAIKFKQEHPEISLDFSPVNLGDSINSVRSEYYPNISIDDSLLVFSRRGEGIREEFMQSKINQQQYGTATFIKGDINNEASKGAITMSADGEWMIFAGNFGKVKGFGDFDLYISYYTPEGWSEPENLGYNINTDFWESSPSLSPDKRVLYFSSNRYGGVGGKDLYYSVRQANGKFGEAMNMGDSINTAGDEYAPYIHPDNKTLYFTSDGWPGYGGADLFMMRRDQEGYWGLPENLGYPINTVDEDAYIAVSADGKTAYYASDRSDSRGGLDLYKFTLPKHVQPAKTLYVKGKVFDKKTNKGLPSTIELIDNSTAKVLMKIQTDEIGDYFITLPTGKDYTFSVNRTGYLYYTEQYSLTNLYADSTYKKDIALESISLNKVVTFNNIQFQNNAYELLPISLIELDKLYQILIDNPNLKVEIYGHTDNIGKASDNLVLSTNRAKSVVAYLIQKGISSKRLSYKGFGITKPIADNTTEAGRAKNRRTEFLIVGL
jgi:outer membrane protein OmpA-like peptidoglycan-associated protein/tetratricopeptide (TPR) repeat protein